MNFFHAVLILIMTPALILSVHPARSNENSSFSFNIVSDMPYNDRQEKMLEDHIIPALRNSPTPFLIHLGDLKAGSSPCTTDLLSQRHNQIMRMHPDYVFYTPGDNDWTDCDRLTSGRPVSELKMLDELRRIFFSNPPSYSATWQVARQPLYPENVRWTYQSVAFATIHIVGTNNGRKQILKDNKKWALSEVDARDAANLIWLQELFEQASRTDALAVILAMQADLSKAESGAACDPINPENCDGFATFRKHLVRYAAEFQKPVLLMHGDTGPFCLDKQFSGGVAPNLWRFNSAGDYHVIDAVKLTVQPDDEKEPFVMETLLGATKPDNGC